MGELDRLGKAKFYTDVSSFALSGVTGLRYYSQGKRGEQVNPFLSKGIRICSLLSEGCDIDPSSVTLEQLDVLKVFAPIRDRYPVGAIPLLKSQLYETLQILDQAQGGETIDADTLNNARGFLRGIANLYLEKANSILFSSCESFFYSQL